jgi:signal peptidase I
MTGRGRKWIWRGATIAVAGLLWGFFAPPALGGSTTVLMVRGTSMLPRFHTGDLVLVRKGDAYRVGMLAAYDALPFHAVFFHQIVGRAGNRYVFKGLNNRVADPYHPPASEIIGAYWFSIPTVGLWLQFWRQPGNAALLVAATALVAAATSPRRRREMSGTGRQRARRAHGSFDGRWAGSVALGVAAAAAVAFTLYAAARAPFRTVSWSVPYQQRVDWSYGAPVPRSVAYPTGQVLTGDPVFDPPVRRLTVRFRYALEAHGARPLGGTAGLSAILTGSNGWRESWELVAPHRFRSGTVSLRAAIDVQRVVQTAAAVNRLTPNQLTQYTLAVVPTVSMATVVRGRWLAGRWTTPLTFSVNGSWLQLVVPAGATPSQVLDPKVTGAVAGSRLWPARLLVLGHAVPIPAAVRFGVLAAVVAGLADAWLWWRQAAEVSRMGAASRIARRYGDLLVDVDRLPSPLVDGAVRVGTIEGLVRLAEQCERLILHAYRDGQHVYLLEHVGEAYYFAASDDTLSVAESRRATVGQEVPQMARSEPT